MDRTYTYQGDIFGNKSVAKAAFNIVRTNCCDGICDLTRQIVSILPNGSNDYEILKTHKYTLISLGNHGRNLYRFGHFPGITPRT